MLLRWSNLSGQRLRQGGSSGLGPSTQRRFRYRLNVRPRGSAVARNRNPPSTRLRAPVPPVGVAAPANSIFFPNSHSYIVHILFSVSPHPYATTSPLLALGQAVKRFNALLTVVCCSRSVVKLSWNRCHQCRLNYPSIRRCSYLSHQVKRVKQRVSSGKEASCEFEPLEQCPRLALEDLTDSTAVQSFGVSYAFQRPRCSPSRPYAMRALTTHPDPTTGAWASSRRSQRCPRVVR